MKPIEKMSNDQLLDNLNFAEHAIEGILIARSSISHIMPIVSEFDNACLIQVRKLTTYIQDLKDEAIRRNAKKGAEQIQLFM